jgi:hypothetical protein
VSRQASQGECRRISPTGRPHTHQGNHCAVSVIASLTSAGVDGLPYSTFFPTERLPGRLFERGPATVLLVPTGPLVAGVIKEPLAHVLPDGPRAVQPRGIDLLDFDDAAHLGLSRNKYSNTRLTGSATKDYDRATDAHFRPDKPRGATGKSLIFLRLWLTLNHRVPGSSAPTNDFKHLAVV